MSLSERADEMRRRIEKKSFLGTLLVSLSQKWLK